MFPNYQDLVVTDAVIKDIFCQTITQATTDITTDIAQLDARITAEEDDNANHTRAGTVDTFANSIKTDAAEFTLTQTSAFTTSSISAVGSVNANTISNPVLTVSGSNVGINNTTPNYNLELQASAIARTEGDLQVNGIVKGPLWNKLASNVITLTSSVGTSRNLATTVGSYTYYPRKIVVVLRNITKTNTYANGPMVTITLGTSSAPFTGGYNHYTRGVGWNGSNTFQSLIWSYTASIVCDGNWSVLANTIKSSIVTLYHMGDNVWSYNGTYSTQNGGQYGNGTIGGCIVCPSQLETIGVSLARPAANGGSDTVYTVDTTARMSGNVQIFFE